MIISCVHIWYLIIGLAPLFSVSQIQMGGTPIYILDIRQNVPAMLTQSR